MPEITYLRELRLRYGIGLPELAKAAHISPQQLSRLELRQTSCTLAQEDKLYQALTDWLTSSRHRLDEIETELQPLRGKLLQNMEECI